MNDQLESLVSEMIAKGVVFEDAVSEFEKRFIKLVLKKADGNQSKAAEILGIHRNTLGRKLGELGLADNHIRRVPLRQRGAKRAGRPTNHTLFR